jgi:hypothetical protein
MARVQRIIKKDTVEDKVPAAFLPVDKEEIKEPVAFVPEARIKQLPSKFLPYPKDCSIFYKPYVFGELTEFNESKVNESDKIRFILQGIRTSFPVMNLTFHDYIVITLYRRISSLGNSNFSFSYVCQKCRNKNRHTATLDSFEFHDLDVPDLPVRAKIGGTELHFMPLTIGNYIDLLESGLVESDEKRIVKMFSKQVVNIKFEEAEKIIFNAWNEEVDILNHIDESLYHGIEPMKVTCKKVIKSPDVVLNGVIALCQERAKLENKEEKKTIWESAASTLETLNPPTDGEPCGHINTIAINRPEVLVRPFRLDRQSLRSRIQFGLGGNSQSVSA